MKHLILPLLLISAGVSAQSLSKPEKNVIATVQKNMPETEAFLEKIVNINSGTLNKEVVRTVGKLMADEFDKLGFKAEWVTLPDSLNRAGHLVATRQWCNNTTTKTKKGYTTQAGWDACTGLGVADGQKLASILLSSTTT